MKKLFLITVFLLTISANAQYKRSVGNFTKINVRGSFDVVLTYGNGNITISAKDEVEKFIKTEVENNTLNIYIEKGFRGNLGDVNIKVPFQKLEAVSLKGSGSITSSETIKSENIEIAAVGSGDVELEIQATNAKAEVSGSGDLKLSGKTTNLQAKVVGSGDLSASRLTAESTEVEVAGSGDAEVYASESIKARIIGSGDIEFYGNPKKEDSKVSGSGSINKK